MLKVERNLSVEGLVVPLVISFNDNVHRFLNINPITQYNC
jgi:hypothetical protein